MRSSNWLSTLSSFLSACRRSPAFSVGLGGIGRIMSPLGSPCMSPSLGSAFDPVGPISPERMRSNAFSASLMSSLMAESCSSIASSSPIESICMDTRRTFGSAPKPNAVIIRPTRRL